jgi:predicted PurR-regulated permease PerM
MNFIRTRLAPSIRTILVAFTCAILIFSTAFPALAGGKTAPTNLTKGEAPLNDIIDKSQDIIQNGIPSMEQVQKEANKGINEVQGSADSDKMNRPDNSRKAVSIEERIKTGLEKAEGKN